MAILVVSMAATNQGIKLKDAWRIGQFCELTMLMIAALVIFDLASVLLLVFEYKAFNLPLP